MGVCSAALPLAAVSRHEYGVRARVCIWFGRSKSSYSHQAAHELTAKHHAHSLSTFLARSIHTHTHLHTQPEATRMQHPSAHTHGTQPNRTEQPNRHCCSKRGEPARPCHQGEGWQQSAAAAAAALRGQGGHPVRPARQRGPRRAANASSLFTASACRHTTTAFTRSFLSLRAFWFSAWHPLCFGIRPHVGLLSS